MHCPFFLALQRGIEPYFDTDGFPAQLLAQHRKILTARWLLGNFVVPFLHILSPIDKAFNEKPMFVQVGLFCTSNLSSGTALQKDFVFCKVRWKHFMINILLPFTLPNIFHLQWSCLKSILLIIKVLQLATFREITSGLRQPRRSSSAVGPRPARWRKHWLGFQTWSGGDGASQWHEAINKFLQQLEKQEKKLLQWPSHPTVTHAQASHKGRLAPCLLPKLWRLVFSQHWMKTRPTGSPRRSCACTNTLRTTCY